MSDVQGNPSIKRAVVATEGGGQLVLSRNVAAGTGRMSGPGITAHWNDAGISRFEFEFNGNVVRFLGVRPDEPWVILATSTVDALGRDGWNALAAALGTLYDGAVTTFDHDAS